jgi:myosin-18
MPDPVFYPTAGRKQFARHEWAQKAAYLLGCSLEELSSAIFKHQHKGSTLQRSTSFRQGPEESSLGEGTGTPSSPMAGGWAWETSPGACCHSEDGRGWWCE